MVRDQQAQGGGVYAVRRAGEADGRRCRAERQGAQAGARGTAGSGQLRAFADDQREFLGEAWF